jgi:hypothetical protein
VLARFQKTRLVAQSSMQGSISVDVRNKVVLKDIRGDSNPRETSECGPMQSGILDVGKRNI